MNYKYYVIISNDEIDLPGEYVLKSKTFDTQEEAQEFLNQIENTMYGCFNLIMRVNTKTGKEKIISY